MNRLFRDPLGPCLAPRGSIVCIGAFDGLHLGHRALLSEVVARAHAARLDAIALSFEPLPREHFSRAIPPARLQLPRARFEGLAAQGCDSVGLLRFNAALASMAAEDFVREVLVKRLNAREVWVGPDFRFGRGRGGDVDLLKRMGAELGFVAHSLDIVTCVDGERVSSSRIRDALGAGALELASSLLGRPYAISGRVVRGKQLGRTLGYPTANQRFGRCLPALWGVYAVRAHGIGDQPLAGVASLGTRPVVQGKEPLLETHMFDFSGDLYGRRLSIEFVAKLRDELNFPDLAALIVQMDRDAARAREILSTSPAAPGSAASSWSPA
ncbi:bifunctional riboflavin kinase/FAD synthetase [Aquimonas sp.]|jgi:riboflavin kinase/FMN adenylyltransferase|uniref:bifunctional riboflavin kinase/FAD synthetase n=1 Tax=Aquimonas sp. TaxID=1872588 RepID=UPI0037BFA4E1